MREAEETKPVNYLLPPSSVTATAMPPSFWSSVGAIHEKCASVFRHPWSIDIVSSVDGEPTVYVHVRAPKDDPFQYDDRIIAALESSLPKGYVFDGTDHDVTACRGLIDRGYYLYPAP